MGAFNVLISHEADARIKRKIDKPANHHQTSPSAHFVNSKQPEKVLELYTIQQK